jgi:hypothetical protein
MTLSICVSQGDWGGAESSNVEAVARSVATSFSAYDDRESVAILLEPASEGHSPAALSATGPSGEFVVRLNVRGRFWARLVYQFAHEYCHVLADPRTFKVDRFTWIEEALCETASLFALRHVSKAWADAPPYPNWRDYSAALARYEAEHVSNHARSLPPGEQFLTWLAQRLPLLEADASRRDDNTIIAKELLPNFEADSAAWRALRHLHTCPRSSASTLSDFMKGWAAACPAQCRHAVQSIAALTGNEAQAPSRRKRCR